jgi:hypothetical protein
MQIRGHLTVLSRKSGAPRQISQSCKIRDPGHPLNILGYLLKGTMGLMDAYLQAMYPEVIRITVVHKIVISDNLPRYRGGPQDRDSDRRVLTQSRSLWEERMLPCIGTHGGSL